MGNSMLMIDFGMDLEKCWHGMSIWTSMDCSLQAFVIVSKLAANHSKLQDRFGHHNIVRFLVGHLVFETTEEPERAK